MSSSLAIAAVTNTLRHLLEAELSKEVPGTKVSTQPPDKVRSTGNSGQVNLFLYQTNVDAAWRNMDIPWKLKPGETGPAPLPLTLYYLITVYYGETEDGVDTSGNPQRLLGSHRLLGHAMSVLHDHPVFKAAEIAANLPPGDRADNAFDQVEHVRITPHSLSLDELSKVWTGFQTQYRLSAAYEASVVLLESQRPAKTPLPVLSRGSDDEGVASQTDLIPPFPTIESVQLPNNQPGAHLGDTLTLLGHHLGGANVSVRFTNRRGRLADPITVPATGTATAITVRLPDEPAHWPAGPYTLQAIVRDVKGQDRTSGEVPLSLAPRIVAPAGPLARDGHGDVTMKLNCTPQVKPQQDVDLLFGDRKVSPSSISTPANAHAATEMTFYLSDVEPGDYCLRLRVDGVDSLLVDRSVTPSRFSDNQKVRIT